nr:hypothetical protein HK105_004856 [Polyrhizophydium stewartii]
MDARLLAPAPGPRQLVLGALFHAEVEELVEGKNAPSDPIAVSKACYAAAFIYLGLGVFCLIQAYMHSKEQQRLQRFSGI